MVVTAHFFFSCCCCVLIVLSSGGSSSSGVLSCSIPSMFRPLSWEARAQHGYAWSGVSRYVDTPLQVLALGTNLLVALPLRMWVCCGGVFFYLITVPKSAT